MAKSIQSVMSYAIRVGLNMDAKDANRNLNTFRREVGLAKSATQDITSTVKLFNEVSKDLNLTSQQSIAVEARLTAAHERRTAKLKAETEALRAAQSGYAAGLANIGTSTLARDVQSSRAGSNAFNAGLRRLSEQSLARDSAVLEANIAARTRHNAVLASGRQYMQQFDTAQQRVTRQLREANAQLRAGAISQEQYGRATAAIRSQNSLIGQSFNQVKSTLTGLVGPLALVYSGYRALKESIKLSAELEQATAKFKVFTGSLREAEQVLRDIRALSQSSPVSFTGGQAAVTSLLQFGVASKDVTKTLRQIAEISGGDTERMKQLALAFGQANAAGRLMGQELLQMVNAGFNPLKVISDQTGRSMRDLKDAMANGEVGVAELFGTLETATTKGGQFNGLLKEMADTTAGKLTQATNSVQELGIAFGDLLALGGTGGVIGGFTNSVNDLTLAVNALKDIGKGGSSGNDAFYDARQFSLTGFELVGQTIDTVKLATAGANKDLFSFIEAYDRTVRRLGRNNLRDIAGKGVVDGTDAIKAALKDLDAVRAKAIEDRTEAETIAINATDRRDRGAKDVSQADYDRLLAQLKQAYANAKTDLAKQELFTKFVDDVGQGFLNDGDVAIYRDYVAEIEKANQAQLEQNRIRASFEESIAKGRDDLLGSRFGSRADGVRLLRDQSTGDERKAINRAIENGADYERIVRLANAEARAQLKTLEAIQAKNKAFEDAKEKQKEAERAAKDAATEAERAAKEKARLEEQARKRQSDDLKRLKRQADDIRDARNPFSGLVNGLADAALLNRKGLLSGRELAAERDRLASENAKNVTATAAPTINKGSQEAFAAITGQTVDKITQQLREAEKQTILATTAAQVRQKTLDKLDELVDDKPGVVGS